MGKFLRNLIGWILYVAFLVGLIFGIPKGLAYFLKTPYPMASITSGSMWPALKKGDLILIKGVQSKNDINLNDIVVFKNAKGFTIHRVVKLGENTLTTKGDANNVSDEPIRYEDVVGKLLELNNTPFRVPMLGNVSIMINNQKI